MEKINLFEDALPAGLFDCLVRAVEAVGMERMEGMGNLSSLFLQAAIPVGMERK